MNPAFSAYLYAFGANLCFGSASIGFSKFARNHSPLFINQIKVLIAFICFLLAAVFIEGFISLPTMSIFYLMFSGFIGLFLADSFMFKAFVELGPSRTLMMFSLQPFLLGLYGYFFLSQSMNFFQFLAVFCMIACVFLVLLERNRVTGVWAFRAFLVALLGVVFDALGVMLSRQGFELSPNLGPFEANFYRAVGAIIGFMVFRPKSFLKIKKRFTALSTHDRKLSIMASIIGTFISLSFYLKAIKTAHVATLTAMTITGPIWVSLIEHVREKTLPHRILWIALVFFVAGFAFMTYGLYLNPTH